MQTPYVYKIIHKETGKFYIGYRSRNVIHNRSPEEDLLVHYFTSGQFSIDAKKNPQNYNIEILFRNQDHELVFWKEQELIKENINFELCINQQYQDITTNKHIWCSTGITRSEETCAKISDRLTGIKRGPMSEAHKAKIAATKIGKKLKPHSVEAKQKMSDAKRGKSLSPEHIQKLKLNHSGGMKGRLHSKETKLKMSSSQKLRYQTN